MKIKLKLSWIFFMVLCASSPARSQDTAFTYQGRLNSGGGQASGIYDLRFTIYDSSGGPSVVAGPLTNSGVAVSNGLFAVTLDFGAGVFTGPSRWLDIAVRTNGNGSFTVLSPRQAITPSPYAIYAGTASNLVSGSAVTSVNNLKDNVVLAAGTNVTITPNGNTLTIASAGAGGSGIWSVLNNNAYFTAGNVGIGTTNPQEKLTLAGVTSYNTGLKVTGNSLGGTGISLENTSSGGHKFDLLSGGTSDGIGVGAFGIFDETIGSYRLSITPNGAVGIGTTAPQAGIQLEVNGATRMTPGGSGGEVRFHTPSGETGMSIFGANRADLRFDGSSLKLLAGLGSGAMPSENGISITTAGNVGIGTTVPLSGFRLEVNGQTRMTPGGSGGDLRFQTPGGETGLSIVGGNRADLRFDGSVVKLLAGLGAGAMPSENGIAVTTAGNVGIGTTAPTAKLTVAGDVNQSRDKGGLVKAMLFVDLNGTITRCYNGITDSSTGGCGFSVNKSQGVGEYTIDFGFPVKDRFFSITPHSSDGVNLGANFSLTHVSLTTTSQILVSIFISDVTYPNSHADASFVIIVY